MRRNPTLRNSFDTDSSSSEYSSAGPNGCNNRSRNYAENAANDDRFFVERSTGGVPNFGEITENHGWVQCTSKSLPGKSYYYNVRSCCSTWDRPAACVSPIPKFPFKMKNFATQSVCSLPLATISDEDEENYNSINISYHSTVNYNKFYEILSRIYYCPPMYSPKNDAMDYNNGVCDSPEIDAESDSVERTNDIANLRRGETDLNETSALLATDFVQTQLDCCDTAKENGYLSRLSFSKKKPAVTSDEDSEFVYSENNENKCENYTVPRLKTIKPCDLSQNFFSKKKRTRNNVKRKQPARQSTGTPKKKIRKIVCDMYGVRTTNYDSVDLELPPGVRKRSLSETSDASSIKSDVKRTKATVAGAFIHSDPAWNITAPELSESTSSCSSFSCTSCDSRLSSTSSSCSQLKVLKPRT